MKGITAVLTGVFVLGITASAMAETIAYTGFEEPSATSSTRYTQSGTEGEALPTQSGVTTSYEGGDELGFETYLISGSGPSVGSESGDYIGVSSYYALSGSHSYEMEDVDDELQLVLETVDLTDWSDVTVSASIQVKLNSYSDYEDGDSISLFVITDVGTFYLCDLVGEDVLDGMVSDGYVTYDYSVAIPDSATWATFVVDVVTNGSNEGVKVDDIYFDGTSTPSAVPVPGTLLLLSTGLLGMVGITRRK